MGTYPFSLEEAALALAALSELIYSEFPHEPLRDLVFTYVWERSEGTLAALQLVDTWLESESSSDNDAL